MRTIIDLHIHSKFSRACSKELELPIIADWCQRKGIDIVATADWTHPGWFAHMQENLVESDGEDGIYRLKNGVTNTRFMLSTEISQIYKKGDKTRRIHNLVLSPSLKTCAKVNTELTNRGFNLKSDGRPILGIDSEDFYKLLKEIDERIIIIPAHAWTPWYAIFGSKSGFDSIEECFGTEMSKYIYAIETGLSSDPKMNWQLSQLDDVMLVSNSDAHSPRNLGREANVMNLDTVSYDEFVRILREKDRNRFLYTIEFHPEEGKYHFDGCSNCKFSCDPKTSVKHNFRCPKCKKKLTLGVHHRVQELSDRDSATVAKNKVPYKSIVPLAEIIAECVGVKSTTSKKVITEYIHLTDTVSDEFTLLLDTPIEQIAKKTNYPAVAEAVKLVREGKVHVTPGYDGVFGKVKVFEDGPPKPTQKSLI